MKTHAFGLVLLAVGLVASVPAASDDATAKQKQPEHGPEWAGLFQGAALPVIWQSANIAGERIAAALTAHQLEGVADWAETIHLAAHALMDQVQLPSGDQQQRLHAALGQAAKLADDVLDGAQHDDQRATSAAFRRLASALTLVKSRLPKDITDATVAEGDLRFATTEGHRHEH